MGYEAEPKANRESKRAKCWMAAGIRRRRKEIYIFIPTGFSLMIASAFAFAAAAIAGLLLEPEEKKRVRNEMMGQWLMDVWMSRLKVKAGRGGRGG
jgi:hypothetical protein